MIGFILPELNLSITIRADDIIDIFMVPELLVLSGTSLHIFNPFWFL
jgi:hypothetical protein